ncbi:hypothetical protein CTAYLR_000248 [Chrysophaeum taylorii]|uniref:Vesicle-fusing ATPase n=1 Tax=Chrysophaeum taylorii TaxID=2483200 RepID=A0AAD7XPN0_9STRA|nr:hypothetical protein CTAYLR_000248 [Chrysophaeum taylorii]
MAAAAVVLVVLGWCHALAAVAPSGARSLARLMQSPLSNDRRQELLDELPVVEEHEYVSARRPLVVPASDATVHVLLPGARLGAAEGLSRVLGGRVRLVETSRIETDACACFGGSRCPRANCEWRQEERSSTLTDLVLDGSSRSFEASRFDVVAVDLSVLVDVGARRSAAGAIRVAAPGPAALASKLWPEPDPVLAERDEWFDAAWHPAATPPPPAAPPARATRSLDDGRALGVAGLDDVLRMLDTRVRVPLAAPPTLLRELGVSPIKGVVFWGPPGCGKSLVARKVAEALATESEPKIVAAPQILERYLGASEENLRELFCGANETASGLRCVVIDEIDAIAAARSDAAGGTPSGAERARDSIVNQLLSIMDGLGDDSDFRTLALATTNRLDLLDPALLRAGRFEVHVKVDPPDRRGRQQILDLHTSTARASGRLAPEAADNLDAIAADLPDGTTGATIAAIVRLGASFALRRYFDTQDLAAAVITLADLERAVAEIPGEVTRDQRHST